jgi:hypothetical protein
MGIQGTLSQQALAVAVEPLASGRRVAVFGDATAGLDSILLDQGARSVVLVDPQGARALAAADLVAPGVSVQAYGDDDPRPVDVAIIADLGIFADPADVIARARRLVGEYGVAVFAAANAAALPPAETEGASPGPRAFDYYDLFDLIAGEFQAVKMVAQLPFYGLALMELGGEEEEAGAAGVNVDTRLAEEGRTPEGFVVVASQGTEPRLHPYSIVELPFEPPPETAPPRPDEAAIAALSDAQAHADALAVQLEETRARAAHAEGAAQGLRRVEAQLEETRARAAKAEGAVEGLRLLEAEVVDRTRRAAALEHEVARGAESHALELARLEDGLRERAQAIRSLEGEVARRDQMVRDLVSALDEAGSTPRPAPEPAPEPIRPVAQGAAPDASVEALVAMRARLDALALDLARREGEAHASAWKIDELERRLAQTSQTPSPPEPTLPRPLDLDELDALRQALVQEHEARVHAESGEELVRLRGEIARQAALLEQLATGRSEVREGAGETEQEVSR